MDYIDSRGSKDIGRGIGGYRWRGVPGHSSVRYWYKRFITENSTCFYLLLMIYAFNIHIAHRMDLTPSEKVEVARRIEEAVGNRQGQRTDLKPKQLPPKLEEVKKPKERESATIASQAVEMKPGNLSSSGVVNYSQRKCSNIGTWDIRDNRLFICPCFKARIIKALGH